MGPSPTRLIEASFGAPCVGRSVDFGVLLPADHLEGESLPLVLHLHGAFSSAADTLAQARPLYDELWLSGAFPRAMIACASTPTRGGFYLDRPGSNWETLIAADFPAYLRTRYAPGIAEALIGLSVGGYAALKLVCSAPRRYVAAVGISPAVFAGDGPGSVIEQNMPAALADLHAAMAGPDDDAAAYLAASVHGRARRHAEEIRQAAPRILIDSATDDDRLLRDGAEYLHGVLAGLRIEHAYRTVRPGGRPDVALTARTQEAIRFVGTALSAAPRPGPR